MKKATRTISGVTPVAVMAMPHPCPGGCVYCPSAAGAPRSYTEESPAVLRAAACGFDPHAQVQVRLDTFQQMGHPVDKVELIVMGGTFLAYPVEYQYRFVKSCYDALNGVVSQDLTSALEFNQSASHRCVGLCVETRPDWCGESEIARLLEFGATRVELGVQTLDDGIHAQMHRGHGVAEIVAATSRLRRYGFKVYYHWMPGLPGSTPKRDLEMTQQLFDEPQFRPDGLKLYPTLVVRGSELESWYRDGRFSPRSTEEMCELLVRMKLMVPPYVRVARLMRDIPRKFIVAGCDNLALRGTIRDVMRERGLQCQCIRCREYGHRKRDGRPIGNPALCRRDYDTADGREVFLSWEDSSDTLFALLRLSLVRTGEQTVEASAVTVRELHVFGPEVALGGRDAAAAQHRGLGAALLAEAERIAVREAHAPALRVLSGVGVRDYYRRLGYALDGAYMTKPLEGVPVD